MIGRLASGNALALSGFCGKCRSQSSRRQMGAKQRLAGVDITKPRDHALIEQSSLQAGLLVGACASQHGGVELIAERLRAEVLEQRLAVERVAGDDFHVAEAAWIVEHDGRTRRHLEHDVIVGAILASGKMKFTERLLV